MFLVFCVYLSVGIGLHNKTKHMASFMPRAMESINRENKVIERPNAGVSTCESVTEIGQWSPPPISSPRSKNLSCLGPIRPPPNPSNAENGIPQNVTARALDLHRVARLYAINSFLFFMAMVITWVCLPAYSIDLMRTKLT
jgi:hypothetical protein